LKISLQKADRFHERKQGELMGMSASQARLLSITARLTNNELSSQLLTNNKIRLASKSEAASDEYMDALNSTKLTYQYFNDNGSAVTYDLTPGLIYSYEPLKSQYSIVDTNGVNLVTAQEAKNYEETDSLYDFLGKYVNVKKVTTPEYDAAKAQYDKDKANFDARLSDWEKECDRLRAEYKTAHDEWEKNPTITTGDDQLYDKFIGLVGTSEHPKFTGAEACYGAALNGTGHCYLHLLNHILDFNGWLANTRTWDNSYTASNGVEFIPDVYEREHDLTAEIPTGTTIWWGAMGAVYELKAVSDGINQTDADGNYLRLCDGDDAFVPDYANGGERDKDKYNLIQAAIDEGRVPTELEILKSDYIYDPATNSVTGIKSLKQKTIDMYYIILSLQISQSEAGEMRDLLINFTEGDLRNLSTINLPEPVLKLPDRPTEPIEPDAEYKIVVDDKDKSQWYTNLWYMMNGSDTANLVREDDDETTNGLFVVQSSEKKNPKHANYKVIDDITAKDPDWLRYALENGIVSIRQAQYYDPGEDGGRVLELESDAIMWKSLGYTNAVDIKSEEDTAKITKAQAKYEKAVKEIEAKDNEYDLQLKNLDTIHNALQTEYESVKNAISKNVERSFKAFS